MFLLDIIIFYAILLLGEADMKKYNWVNDEIKINFKVPRSIEHQIEELEKLDEEKKYTLF